jgi:hypothetical protein
LPYPRARPALWLYTRVQFDSRRLACSLHVPAFSFRHTDGDAQSLPALRVYANSFRSIFCGFSNGSPSTLRRRESPRHHAHSKHTPRAHTPHPSSDRRMRRAVHHIHCRAHQRARRVTRRPANARSLHPIFNTYTARHYVAATTGCPGTTLKCRPPSEAC